MKYSFDEKGYLIPHRKTAMTLLEFEALFANETTGKRRHLFDEFMRYNKDLAKLIGFSFTQWIDGSFVSRKRNPNDIDMVTFIDYDVYQKFEQQIDSRFSKWSVRNFYTGLDAYTVWEYPAHHKFYDTFKSDCAYWYNWFGITKANRSRKKFQKGFVELKYTSA